ncbi:hypothetical protein ACWELJ_32125 [Nocardia sp. NPDC004582]
MANLLPIISSRYRVAVRIHVRWIDARPLKSVIGGGVSTTWRPFLNREPTAHRVGRARLFRRTHFGYLRAQRFSPLRTRSAAFLSQC